MSKIEQIQAVMKLFSISEAQAVELLSEMNELHSDAEASLSIYFDYIDSLQGRRNRQLHLHTSRSAI